MRNTNIIESIAMYFDRQIKLRGKPLKILEMSKNITGPVCYHYFDKFRLGRNLLARAAINKYFPKPKEPVVVIHDDCSKVQQCGIYVELLNKFASQRDVVYLPVKTDDYKFKSGNNKTSNYEKYTKEVEKFLEKPEGILVTDIEAFQGAQARNTIIFVPYKYSPESVRNMILRTMSFTIIIHERKIEPKISGLIRDEDLHEHLHSGIPTPVCYFYNKENVSEENTAAIAIVKKQIMNNPYESILLLTFCNGEQLGHQLQENFTGRQIIVQSRLNTYEDPNKNMFAGIELVDTLSLDENNDKERYFDDLKISLEKKKTIVIANLFDVEHKTHRQPDSLVENLRALLERFTNIVIFSMKTDKKKRKRDTVKMKEIDEDEFDRNSQEWFEIICNVGDFGEI